MSAAAGTFGGSSAEWDAFVQRSPGWTHFHLHGWKTVIERAFGHECLYAACRGAEGQLEGILPLVRVRSRLFGHFLVSMPFVNYGGPLGGKAAVRLLVDGAAAAAVASGARLLELRSRMPLAIDHTVSHHKVTVLLDIPEGGAAGLWKILPAKLRSQVRKPQKEGLTMRFGLDQLEPFYSVFARNMRDLGTPVQSRRLFETIASVFPGDVWFGCAYLGTKPVAGGCGFRWASEFEMTWASFLREHHRVAPNMMLYWAFIERCAELGLRVFNFGRCTPGSGTHRFKLQWGPVRDQVLWWYRSGPAAGTGTPSPDQAQYAWGPRLWRRLPVAVANLVGPSIVKFVP